MPPLSRGQDGEAGADLLGSLRHRLEAEAPLAQRLPGGVRLDPGARVVDGEDRPIDRGLVPDVDRRATVAGGVGERLLRNPEDRQLHAGRWAGLVEPLEHDLVAGQAADARDQPFEGRAGAQVVEDRHPELTADLAQLVGHASNRRRCRRISRQLEAPGQQEEVLEGAVVELCGQPGALRLGDSHDQVPLGR